MTDKKKDKSVVKKPSVKKARPLKQNNNNEAIMQCKTIYCVNGKFKSQLVGNKEHGWICQIWSNADDGRQRPMLRNVQPFATIEEAIQMAQKCFASYTGDDRYFAIEDIKKEKKTKPGLRREAIHVEVFGAERINPQADTSALEGEIDQLVYELYGLTEDEVKIVEGK